MDQKNDSNNQKAKKPLKKQKTKTSNYSSKNYEVDKNDNKSSRSGQVIAKSESKSITNFKSAGRPPKTNVVKSPSPPKKIGTTRNTNIHGSTDKKAKLAAISSDRKQSEII